jgi:hypothetical protein
MNCSHLFAFLLRSVYFLLLILAPSLPDEVSRNRVTPVGSALIRILKFAFLSAIRGLKFDVWCFPGAWILVLGIFLGFGF